MKLAVPPCFAAFTALPMDVALRIRAGLPAALVEEIAQFLELRQETLIAHLRLPAEDLRGRIESHGSLASWEAGRLCWTAQAYFEAAAVLESDQGAIEWLGARVPALGHVAPLSLLDTPAGYQLVVDTLGQIRYGVFA